MSGQVIDESIVISASDINQQFKVGNETITALEDVNFSIQSNSFNIIFGPSGSGKSTLLDIIAGLQKPSSGQLLVEGRDIYSLPPDELAHYRANRVGFVHQTSNWVKSLNVIENIAIPLFALGYTRTKALNIAAIALDRVNMGTYATKSPVVLSGGEQQRLAMARALANDPLLIVADEPTGNLDSSSGDNIMKLLLECQTEFRRTIILVTHNMEYISLANHLLKINDGKLQDVASDDKQKETEILIKDIKKRIKYQAEIRHEADK